MTDFDLGGSGGSSFSFGPQGAQPGAHIAGTVLDAKEVQTTHYDGPEKGKPEFWPNGDPKMQHKVTLQTELRDPNNPLDDGKRDVYLDGRRRPNDNGTKSKMCAVLDAVRAATGGTALQYGGKLTLQWISGMGFTGDPRNYQAWYEPPAMQLEQPPQHAAPAQAPAAPQFGSPVHQEQVGPPPTWAAPAPQAPVAPQAPPAGPPAAAWGAPAQPPAPQAPQQIPGTAPAAAPPTAAPANGISPEQVASLQAAGIDPVSVYGPGWEQRVSA